MSIWSYRNHQQPKTDTRASGRMKIILSRTGIDSGALSGRMASPILPCGCLCSIPIPYKCGVSYSEIQFEGRTFQEIVRELNPNWSDKIAHLDPDLRGDAFGGFLNNVLTGGGSSALAESGAALNLQLDKHRESVQTFETANSAFRSAVESLGSETTECMALLRASQDFVERLSYSAFSSKLPNLPVFTTPDLSNVSATLSTFDAAITAGTG